jgi:hypothetical protein
MSGVLPRNAPENFQLLEHPPGKEEEGTEQSGSGIPKGSYTISNYLAQSLQQDLELQLATGRKTWLSLDLANS